MLPINRGRESADYGLEEITPKAFDTTNKAQNPGVSARAKSAWRPYWVNAWC